VGEQLSRFIHIVELNLHPTCFSYGTGIDRLFICCLLFDCNLQVIAWSSLQGRDESQTHSEFRVPGDWGAFLKHRFKLP